MQPPSGGCVLKLFQMCECHYLYVAAAFGRLCVETLLLRRRVCDRHDESPAAFGRLCVETLLLPR